jgi:signal transduction histidine kinase
VKGAISSPRRDTLFDLAAVTIAAVLGVATTRGSPPVLEPLGGATVAGQTALALCLLLRRRMPLTVAWIMTAAAGGIAVVDAVAPGTLVPADLERTAMPWLPPAALFSTYAVTAYAGARRVARVPIAWAPVVALVVLGSHAWDAPPNSPWSLQSLIFILGPALLGTYMAARRRLLQSVMERAERAEREQQLLAEQARLDERTRLAAEMHDVVTHRVSLMVLRAGALLMTADSEATKQAAEELRAAGSKALDELRDLVGILRDSATGADNGQPVTPAILSSSDRPVPIPDLSGLLAESESVGVPVAYLEEGEAMLVAPVVGRTAYRVVQEALTNVRKHAPGASARVHLRYRAGRVSLTVHNTASTGSADPALAAARSGTGLLGLRQRVELIDGTLEAGPSPDGGFDLVAILPAHAPTTPQLEDVTL